MQATNEIEEHFITVYTLLLNAEIPEHRNLDSNEVQQLSVIASLWPQYVGPAVYIARAALWYQQGLEFNTEADRNIPITAKVDFETCMPSLPALSVKFMGSNGMEYATEGLGADELGNLFLSPAYFNQLQPNINYAFVVTVGGVSYSTSYLSIQEWLSSNTQHIAVCGMGKKSDEARGLELPVVKNEGSIPVTLYPNPSTGNFTLQGIPENMDAEVSVYNVQGKEVMVVNIANGVIDLQHEANGIYYIRIKGNNGKVIHQQTLMVNH
jgi:hypothetical protein